MMFREANCFEAEVLAEPRQFDDFGDHLLKELGVAGNGPQRRALGWGNGNCRVEKVHELHGPGPPSNPVDASRNRSGRSTITNGKLLTSLFDSEMLTRTRRAGTDSPPIRSAIAH